ncbi:hypothetical protein AVEN_91379-1 [Araneus ventricosus]|uniref:Uncharacterized protein n=1 Tax=Araneus ventricosus TaxID=182803 RepID=A0A4Y2HWL5_ARAVE|nr:hypothetical protein AVEN_91379-1 [Araneus ventricosus]
MFFLNRDKDNYLFVLSLHQACFANLQQACIGRRWQTCCKLMCYLGELRRIEKFIMKSVQAGEFAEEIHRLKTGKPVNTTNKRNQLNPFPDEDVILSVGGRLANAKLPYRVKHPYIIPKTHSVTSLIVR